MCQQDNEVNQERRRYGTPEIVNAEKLLREDPRLFTGW